MPSDSVLQLRALSGDLDVTLKLNYDWLPMGNGEYSRIEIGGD
jgi:hypothetical protein